MDGFQGISNESQQQGDFALKDEMPLVITTSDLNQVEINIMS